MPRIITSILVPTDFSPPSEQAFNYARGLAKELGARLHLVHVVNRQLLAEGLAAEASIADGVSIGSALVEEAKARLQTLAPDAASAEVVFGYAAKSIVEYASRVGVDLVVMGSHGRSGLAHVLLGSVAEAVVRTAPCPVLTVRQPVNASRSAASGQPEAAPTVK